MSQVVLTVAAKQLEGLASIPVTEKPRFIASTSVVPDPQNGSSTLASPSNLNSSRSSDEVIRIP